MNNKPKYIIVHHTAVSYQRAPVQFWAVNRYHRYRAFPKSSLGFYGGYHTLIEKDGTELRYRFDHEEGAHTNQIEDGTSMNFQSLAVCLAGNFDEEMPTPAQIKALKKRITTWRVRHQIPLENTYPHRHWATYKSCYGNLLPDDWARRLFAPAHVDDLEKQAYIQHAKSVLDRVQATLLRIRQALDARRYS